MNQLSFEKNIWIYEHNADNSARFVLGQLPGTSCFEAYDLQKAGEQKILACIGVNPSTATPLKLDPTLRAVRAWATRLGFDGWVMFNLYPLRATDPNELPVEADIELHIRNLIEIDKCIRDFKIKTVWAAWGTLIEKRKYLLQCLREILRKIPPTCDNWFTIGKRSKRSSHPHHPLYLSTNCKPETFYPSLYVRDHQEDEL
jgi:hypothetical protein